MTISPLTVAANRTARLVREANTPVYSTTTPVREHVFMVELEDSVYGSRHWVSDHEADVLLALPSAPYVFSDRDHSTSCWCQK